MAVGYDHPLYLMPFDHRESLETKMFDWEEPLTREQAAEVVAAKRTIYDGFLKAVADGAPRDKAGILVDEEFGAEILRDASQRGIKTACPVEKSGRKEFDFEYGDDFARHIEAVDPTFSKVFVRYNPEGDAELNRRQLGRLKHLSDYLHGSNRLFMFELVVPAEPGQLARFDGDRGAYDVQLRPRLMVQAIHDVQEAGVEPDVWKLEGLDRRDDCEQVVAAARRDRDRVGCIVLGRGADAGRVRTWLTNAASVDGFIGFAVGRTTFWDPLVDLRAGRITREAAVADVARRYREWVDLFETARERPKTPGRS